ncbi:hypothetical protein ACQZV8_10700 [Magnetococcales bacterium HHB-1]
MNDASSAKVWNQRLEQAQRQLEGLNFYEEIKKNRAYAAGRQHDDGQPGLVRVNLIHATISGTIPHLYARNPEIDVRPTETIDGDGYQWSERFAKTLELVLNRQLQEGLLKSSVKSALRSVLTTGLGWIKSSWQDGDLQATENSTPTIDVEKITQDQAKTDKEDSDKKHEDEATEEISDHGDEDQSSVEEKPPLKEESSETWTKAPGLALDAILSEDVLVDPDLRDPSQYMQAGWIAHRVWLSPIEVEMRFGFIPEDAKIYGLNHQESRNHASTSKADKDVAQELLAVWEIWHKSSRTMATLAEGSKKWLLEPHTPDPVGKRFYPFFLMVFNPIDGEFLPLADVALMRDLQDEYNRIRTQLAEHRRIAVPHWIASADALQGRDIERIANPKIGEIVVVESAGRSVKDAITVAQVPPINPTVYDTTQVRHDLEQVSGLTDAARGVVNRAKTATEAEILQSGLTNRTSERRDIIEDMIRDLANNAAELILQAMPEYWIKKMAGPKAVWPVLDQQKVFDTFRIEIKAGTSGRPNKFREQEQWVQLLPKIEQLFAQIVQAQQQGETAHLSGLLELAKETLRRFDERLDIERFFPNVSKVGEITDPVPHQEPTDRIQENPQDHAATLMRSPLLQSALQRLIHADRPEQ